MANRRVLVKRRTSVRNIRKITRTMQLIATARFQAAFNRAMATKPFTKKLAELAADLSRAAGNVSHPLLETNDAPRSVLLVLTGDRGLAGGYNTSILRAAIEHMDRQQEAGITSDVHMVGKKGIAYFKFLRRAMSEQTTIGDKPRFDQIEPIANALMDRFIRGEISSVHVAYMRFLSTSVQRPMVVQLLPLQPVAVETPQSATTGQPGAQPSGRLGAIDYEFSPDPQQLLDDLLPTTVRVLLFQAFNDATVSEQVARMVAMKAATDAAGDMIKSLTRQYNRARQTQITMELLDIVGGANALA